jgi:hypothetical protein
MKIRCHLGDWHQTPYHQYILNCARAQMPHLIKRRKTIGKFWYEILYFHRNMLDITVSGNRHPFC